ncbi:MAG TPA: ATP-binding protein, partial [Geobacteraceae bacterium]
GNAVKFTESGGVTLGGVAQGGEARLTVCDSGPGRRADDMGKLFLFFSRITSNDLPQHEGTGLGLYISKKIMAILGGDIWAESEFGKGSTFTVSLPSWEGEAQ